MVRFWPGSGSALTYNAGSRTAVKPKRIHNPGLYHSCGELLTLKGDKGPNVGWQLLYLVIPQVQPLQFLQFRHRLRQVLHVQIVTTRRVSWSWVKMPFFQLLWNQRQILRFWSHTEPDWSLKKILNFFLTLRPNAASMTTHKGKMFNKRV